MLPKKPYIPPELTKVIEKLDLRATLLLQGLLLDHALTLVGVVAPKKKSIIEL